MSDNIEVKVNIPSYEYDIHSLVKAFYPKSEVSVQVKDAFDTDCMLKLDVIFTDGQVEVCTLENDQIIYKGSHDFTESAADDYADSHINYIAFYRKFLKLF